MKSREITNQMLTILSGHYGEVRIDEILTGILLPEPYTIIPNFHARISQKRYTQIDTLIITSKFILHIEIKNIRGKIEFLQNPSRMKRTYDEKESYFDCPFTQIQRNHYALLLMLRKLDLPIPVHRALVFANKSCEIVTSDKRCTILFPKQLEAHILELSRLPSVLNKRQLKQLVNQLHSFQTPFLYEDICLKQGLDLATLKKGVFCQECTGRLIQQTRNWKCGKCGSVERNPLPRTLKHLLQFSSELEKSKELRKWLGIKSQQTLYRARKTLMLQISSIGNGTS